MRRYQRRVQRRPTRRGDWFKCLLAAAVSFYLLRPADESNLEMSERDPEEEYHSVRKAVPQDFGQPENEMMHFVDQTKDIFQEKFVELFMSAEGKHISTFAGDWLPVWVKDYFKWHLMQPIDSHQLIVKDLNYLDIAIYAAAQMNRLLILDFPETTMVERSSLLDWTRRSSTKATASDMTVLHHWNQRETSEPVVLASQEFLQSLIVAKDRDVIPPSLFRYMWHSMIQPSRDLLHFVRNNMDENALSPGHFVSVNCRISVEDEPDLGMILQTGKHAIQCGQWALRQAGQETADTFFISNNHELNKHVQDHNEDMLQSSSGLERIIIAETLKRHEATSNTARARDDWWINLYMASLSRCNVYGNGGFGELPSKISNTDCQLRYEDTEIGTALLCPSTLLT